MSDSTQTAEQKAKRSRGYPHWAFPSKRAFQRQKRKDLRELKKGLGVAQMGAAYLPGYQEHWKKLQEHFDALYEAARPRNWK